MLGSCNEVASAEFIPMDVRATVMALLGNCYRTAGALSPFILLLVSIIQRQANKSVPMIASNYPPSGFFLSPDWLVSGMTDLLNTNQLDV